MSLYPRITFRVKLYDIQEVVTLTPRDDLDNRLLQLQNATIQCPGLDRVLKHDDTFVLYGKHANYVRENYSQYFIVESISLFAGRIPATDFIADVTSGDVPLTVQFTDNSNYLPTAWSWTFGDGGTSQEQNPEHIYEEPGTYSVTLVASNADGENALTKNAYIVATGVGGEEPPGPPENLMVAGQSDYTVSLSWEPPTDEGSAPVDTYIVEYKNDGEVGGLSDIAFQEYGTTSSTSIDVTPLGTDKNYSFRVAAQSAVGVSPYTDPVSTATNPVLFPTLYGVPHIFQAQTDGFVGQVFYQETGYEEDFVEYTPTLLDGEPIGTWDANGFVMKGFVTKPVLRTDITNGDRTFKAVEFEGGSRLRYDGTGFASSIGAEGNGYEVAIVMRRFAPQPPVDRQTTGLWYFTSENGISETDVIDSHYPDDNAVIYERWGSDVRREIFPVPIDVTEWHIYQIRAREGEYKIWINGSLVLDSTDNVLANAPPVENAVLGVSYFWPPDPPDEEADIYHGYFQVAEMIIANTYEDGDLETPQDVIDAREAATLETFRWLKDKYDIAGGLNG